MNGSPGPYTGSINSSVTLTNAGAAATFLWTIIDQPEGAADILSSTTIANPTYTPKKEGTTLIRLTTDAGTVNEAVDQQALIILDLKTGRRAPAAGETIEVDATAGWKTDVNRWLRDESARAADGGLTVGMVKAAGLQHLAILSNSSSEVIKSGLPGQEYVPGFTRALANNINHMGRTLFLLETGVDGSSSPANGALVRARAHGLVRLIPGSGAEAVGDPVYVSNAGALSWLVPGNFIRQVGTVVQQNGATFDIQFDGHMQLRQIASQLFWGNGLTSDTGGAVFALDGPGYNQGTAGVTPGSNVVSHGGFISRLYVRVGTAPVGGGVTFTVLRNGSPTLLTCNLGAGLYSASDLTPGHGTAVNEGDQLTMYCQNDMGVTTGATLVVTSVEFSAA